MTPGTCLPISKGGTGCDYKELILESGLYPIGSVLTTTTNTNPRSYLGGTWEGFGDGRTLVGVGNNGTTNYAAAQQTGGADSVTLTVAQMPSHTHNVYGWPNKGSMSGVGVLPYDTTWGSVGGNTAFGQDTPIARATGGNGSHENRMSYITVYFWKRVS